MDSCCGAGAELAVWTLQSVEPRSGALSYPPPGLELVGTLALPLGVLAFLQHVAAAGSYGLAWVVVGAYVATTRPRSTGRTG